MKLGDIAEKLNLFGIPYSWKENSLSEFLRFNGYEIVEAKENGEYWVEVDGNWHHIGIVVEQ